MGNEQWRESGVIILIDFEVDSYPFEPMLNPILYFKHGLIMYTQKLSWIFLQRLGRGKFTTSNCDLKGND